MMNTSHYIRNIVTLTACTAVCASGLLLGSCRRDGNVIEDNGEYTAVVHIETGSAGTRAVSDSEINSIAIFAFTGDALVGYVYETGLTASGKNNFPITLNHGGVLDFYVIANSEPGFYHLVDEAGEELDLSGTVENLPDNITPERLWNSRVEFHQGPSAQGNWYIPMNNLPGAGLINFRFTVSSQTTTYIPIDLTRAVSKIEVWFRSNDNTEEPPTIRKGTSQYPIEGMDYNRRSYYSIERLQLSVPVSSIGTYGDDSMYAGTPVSESEDGPFNYQSVGGFDNGFPDYDPDNIPNNFYSEVYFKRIWEFYIFPNMYGGNTAGELPEGVSDITCTTLEIDYCLMEENGSYIERKEGYWWNERFIYEWHSNGYERDDRYKTVYLPACGRNSNIRVWCALNDDTDRSFTYTVSDWDETVTVNVPDFE